MASIQPIFAKFWHFNRSMKKAVRRVLSQPRGAAYQFSDSESITNILWCCSNVHAVQFFNSITDLCSNWVCKPPYHLSASQVTIENLKIFFINRDVSMWLIPNATLIINPTKTNENSDGLMETSRWLWLIRKQSFFGRIINLDFASYINKINITTELVM